MGDTCEVKEVRKILIGVFVLSAVVGVGLAVRMGATVQPNEPADLVEQLLAEMSLEEKVGQLMSIGIPGETLDGSREHIKDINPGGIVLFARNVSTPQQLIALTDEMQRLSSVPVFVSIDQEGGAISRIRFSDVVMPGAMAVGATRSAELARQVGGAMGTQLRALGVNMNFAPVLDVNNNRHNPIIGIRSYGEYPDLVAELGSAYIKGLQEAGVAAVAKHFPGHGDTSMDSHLQLPSIPHGLERLRKVEMVPFQAAVDADVAGIMSAHIIFRALDPSGTPATLSRSILTGVLRDDWEYRGLVVTDDLEMKAIADNYGAEAGLRAIQAGADMFLVCHNKGVQKAMYDRLLAGARSGAISEERIDQSVRRILEAKRRLGLFSDLETPEKRLERHDTALAQLAEVAQQVADQSVTVVRDRKGLLPLQPGQSVLVLAPEGSGALNPAALGPRLAEYGNEAQFGVNVTTILFGKQALPPDLEWRARQADSIVLVTSNAAASSYQRRVYERLKALQRPLIVVAATSPYDADSLAEVGTCIALYSPTVAAMDTAARVLLGMHQAVGKPPVTLRP